MDASDFDWDDGNRSECQKHGVTIAEIEAVFASNPVAAPDVRHSQDQDRYISVGRNEQGRAIFVAFTLRQKGSKELIRPLSARFMHKAESQIYGQDSAEAED